MKNLLYGASLVLLFFVSIAAVVAVLLNREKAEEEAFLKSENGSATGMETSIGQCRVTFGVNGGRLNLVSFVKVNEQVAQPKGLPSKETMEVALFVRLLDDSGREMMKIPLKAEEAQILTQPDIELKALPPKLSFSVIIPNLPRNNALELFYMSGPSGLKSLGQFSLPLPE